MSNDQVDRIVERLAPLILESVKEHVYEQTKDKDQEVSNLHREILDGIKDLKETVDSHDKFIKEWDNVWRTAGTIKKWFLAILIFVPTIAGFVAGISYLRNIFK